MKEGRDRPRLKKLTKRASEDPFVKNDQDLTSLRSGQPKTKKSGSRVLLVDDDLDQLSIFEAMLAKCGYEVVKAQSAQEGFSVLKGAPVDIILCDVMMPKVNGDQFVKHIRKFPRFANIPVIMLTASGNDLEMQCLATGADMFCDKSQAARTLLSQIKMLL